MAGLRILAAQGVALYLSEYRDSRGIFTGVLSSMCLLAGMMIPEYLGAAVGYPAWIPFLGIPIHLSILLLLWYFFVPVYREELRRAAGEKAVWLQQAFISQHGESGWLCMEHPGQRRLSGQWCLLF